jgi:hypothetical protein
MSTPSYLHSVPGEPWIGSSTEPPTRTEAAQASDTTSGAGGQPPTGGAQRSLKQRAEKSLPTDRLSFDKQVEVLRSIARFSGGGKRPVTAEDLSASIGLRGNTGGLSNKFFLDCGWVERVGRGSYAATDDLLEYHRHLNVDEEDAAGARARLIGPVKASWFWQVVGPLVEGGAVREKMALHALSKEAGAFDHTSQLQLILSWLEWLGLIKRDGELLSAGSGGSMESHPTQADLVSDAPASQAVKTQSSGSAAVDEHPRETHSAAAEERASVESTPSPTPAVTSQDGPENDRDALLTFNFSLKMTADDVVKLDNAQLTALLNFAEKLRG